MKHIVGFSGGIDSQACARWVLNRFPAEDVILMNSDAGGNEHPLTTAFVETYSRVIHPVVSVTAIYADIWEGDGEAVAHGFDPLAPLDFPSLMDVKRTPPTPGKGQYCTEILKLRPQRRWLRAQFGPTGPFAGEAFTRYSGKRRDESAKRCDTPFSFWDDWFDCETFAPLMDWTKPMCFAYVRAYHEPMNPLYMLGFDRVGCAPCINSDKADIANWAARFPEMIDKIRAWEERTGLTFFRPIDRNKERNAGKRDGIDEQVRWANTRHGGQKVFLPLARPSCESKYGLCE